MAFASKDTKNEYGQPETRVIERLYGKHYSNCCNTTCIMHPLDYWEGGESPVIALAEVCVCPGIYKDSGGKPCRCGKPQYVKIHPGPIKISEVEAKRFALDGVMIVSADKNGKLVQYQSKKFKSYEEVMKGKEKPDEFLFASFTNGSLPADAEEDPVPF